MKFNTILDGFDSIMKVAVEFVNQKYKVKKKIEDFKMEVLIALYQLKRNFVRSIVESILIVSGIISLIVGAILFTTRFFPLDATLMGYGLLVLVIVLLQIKLKP